ncbi:MAG TPA: NAD(P)H-dependent oxidoreductase subunit E, partial [Chthoniobacterales bacterium]
MAPLITALQRIQRQFGYLKRDALEQFSQESGVPLYRLHSVASFFPHFQLTPPKPVTLRICRDMACRMSGSGRMLRELESAGNNQIAVQGVSCLGRCDRAPAACVAVTGSEHDHFYFRRSTAELKQIAQSWLRGAPPPADHDGEQPFSPAPVTIDPYAGRPPEYASVMRAVTLRDEALDRAVALLEREYNWPNDSVARFRNAVVQQRIDPAASEQGADAMRDWLTEDDWAKGPELAGWSEVLLAELKAADLRGLGGAGIPAIQKWRDVRDAVRTAFRRREDTRAFVVVNGDESEPGTFKDRELLSRMPHLIVEGVILAALITGATEGFIFIRHEYPEQIAQSWLRGAPPPAD